MPKDRDEGNKRIEGVFGQIGLGNIDPERILQIQEEFERQMALADFMKSKKGRSFRAVMRNVENEAEEKKPEDKKTK